MQTPNKPRQLKHLTRHTGCLHRILILFLVLSLLLPTFGAQAQRPVTAQGSAIVTIDAVSNNDMLPAPYTLTDLGTLGGSESRPVAINEAGQVIGWSHLVGNTGRHAFVWENGVMTDLSLGGSESEAVAINEAGQVVGWSYPPGSTVRRAFFWDNGVMTDLGTLDGPGYSTAIAINEAGQVLGRGSRPGYDIHRAFVWEDGVMTDLGTLGGRSSGPAAINEAGQVIGTSSLADNTTWHAFVWKDGVMTDLGAPDGRNSVAVAINEVGQILGYSCIGGNFSPRAVVWDDGIMTDLGTLGGSESIPVAINEAGQVVGYSDLANGSRHAFVWEGGVMTDLGTLDGGVSYPIAINEAGQVLGASYHYDNTRFHGFVWDNGVMTDLATLGGGYSRPVAINEAGQVVGSSSLAGDVRAHAFFWENGVMTDLGALEDGFSYSVDINETGHVVGYSDIVPYYHAFVATPGTNTDIHIGGRKQASYYIAPHQSMRKSFAGVNYGPVRIRNTQTLSMMAAERVIYKVNGINTSFSEMMGLPASQLDTTYWLPWYNNLDLDTQLRFANSTYWPGTVHVYIGGTEMPGSPFTLAGKASIRKSFPGVNSGPVKIESNVDIVATERVIYKVNGVNTSFTEMMALPNSQLDNIYWLPWYNNVDLDTQLRFANVSGSPATVHVYIASTEMAGSPFSLAAGASIRRSLAGINNGPVKIESNVDIVAAERVIYKVNGLNTSFSETMALPNSQLDNIYWLPWYNNVDLDTQLRFANVSGSTATVHVFVGGTEMLGSPFTLAPGASTRRSFAGVNSGPVKIESNVDIVAAERVIYKVNGLNTSYSEMMGLPNSQLDTTYWLPWYNNVDLDTQLRFGIP